jgi:hypothetical protein
VLNILFAAPLRAVISGFLTSSLIFLGAHVNRVPRNFSVAFKLMLRIMAVYPLVSFLNVTRWGAVPALLIYGYFVIRGVRKTFAISLQNTLLFFGIAYVVFALLQLQALLKPVPPEPLRNFSMARPAISAAALRGNAR